MIGSPTSIGNKTLTWMNGRELFTYSDGTNNISYKYNIDGIRTSKIVNGIETKYYLEGRRIIFEDRNGDVIYYIYNGDELLGFVYNNNTYYYHKNIFGDIIGILDSNYNEIVSYEYDSWGALVNLNDNSNINLGTINPFRYRSYYYDNETKLYYLNSRYYNPQVGRFINADGYVSTGQGINSANMFMYCGNNSVVREDPMGRWILPEKKSRLQKFNKKSAEITIPVISNIYLKSKRWNISNYFFNKAMYSSNKPLDNDIKKEIEKQILKDKTARKIIDESISKNDYSENSYTDKVILEFSNNDLKYSIGHATAYIEGSINYLGLWEYNIRIYDVYDFTEWIENPRSPGEWANNLGYRMQEDGLLETYYWEVNFRYL